jgi:chemotaxis protein methyltransferase CheR
MSPGEIEEIELKLLVTAMNERYGYDLRNYAPSFLRRRLEGARAKSRSTTYAEMQHRVLYDHAFFLEVLEALSIGVTEMFRDPPFFEAFRARVVPMLRTYPLPKILHAGCATGEEVYATAIILKEEDVYERCQIHATDVSGRALEHAKQGVYPATRVSEIAEAYERSGGKGALSDHYTEAYGGIAFRDSLRRNVLFFEHNLVSDHVFGEMHVIFCRNVLIYFDKELKHRVVRKFAASLRSGGVLCLGSSERLSAQELALGFRELVPERRIYRYEP